MSLLGIVPNPHDGTLSICLEYLDAGSLQDVVKMAAALMKGFFLAFAISGGTGLSPWHARYTS